ncbi:MAG: cell division protein FtsA [Tannerella sp.]|jgi:cell division protein FtsA|nr:cell division protein FtsA [Tannerella sp.]
MRDYIVAIDLGTSHITGIVGEKKADGMFSVIACETEDSSSCIRRGNIYNVDNTEKHVASLVRKLERSLNGGYIDRVYVGVGGQSLRTVNHVESKKIKDGETVSADDIQALREQCGRHKFGLQDVLEIAPATYYVDGRLEKNPVGIPCEKLEAHYKVVIGRNSIRRDIVKSIHDRCGKTIAGIVVSPLALADAMLSSEEKELGCALVDFGAGVTSVTVYKNGDLLYSAVIPLGGNLITHDITSLQLTETVSEKLKREYGSAIPGNESDDEKIKVDLESANREISLNDLNVVVEARAKEIVENVYARISEVTDVKALSQGIVLAGCASELKKLPELIRERFKIKARPSAIRGGLISGGDEMLGNPLYMMAVSLMLRGVEPCVSHPATPEPVAPDGGEDVVEPVHTEPDPVPVPDTSHTKRIKKGKNDWRDLIVDIFKGQNEQ